MRALLLLLTALAAVVGVLLFAWTRSPSDAGASVERGSAAPRDGATLDDPLGPGLADPGPGAARGPGAPDPEAGEPAAAAALDPPGAPAEPAAPPTSVLVRWRGTGGAGGTALAIQGHRVFMDGLDPGDEPRESALEPVEPGLTATTFEGLAYGAWSIGVRDSEGTQRWATATLREESPVRVVEFAIGGSAVRGTVWGANGAPLAGATITVQSPSADGGAAARTTTAVLGRTEADGRYEISGLHGGGGWFIAEMAGDDGAIELASHVLAIPYDDVKVVDVGSPLGSTTVTLTVVDVGGEPLTSGSIEAHEKTGGRTVHGALDADGKVQLELPPSGWRFQLWSLDGNQGVIGELDLVGGGTVEHWLHLGGPRILGDLQWPEGQPTDGALKAQKISLRAGDDPKGRVLQRSSVDATGRFRFDGIAPGTYTLTGYPRPAAAPRTITLGENETTLRVTLALTAP